MSTGVSRGLQSVELNTCCPVSGGKSSDPSGAGQQASPTAAMENSLTEKRTKKLKRRICAFFKRTWRAFKCTALCCHRGCKVSPQGPQSDTDPSNLKQTDCQTQQPGLSDPEAAACHDCDDPLPGSSNHKPAAPPESEDPEPGSSEPESTSCYDCDDPQSGSSNHKPAALSDDPEPGSSEPEAASCQNCEDPEPGSSNHKPAAPPGLDDPQPGPSGLQPTPDTDLVDPEPVKRPFFLLYYVEELLGSGAFGSVFKGTRRSDGQQVAIKFIKKRQQDRFIVIPDSSKPLFAEVALNLRNQKAPRSQHVLQMYQWFDEPQRYILILEYPHPCETLEEFIVRRYNGYLPETLARGLMRQLVLAAKHCMDRGVYHNDIKQDNILVNPETLQLKLIDFGCGDFLKDHIEGDPYRRKLSSEYLDATDETIFSLGVLLVMMLNGQQTRYFFDADNVSDECHDLVMQCTKREIRKRATLEQLLAHQWFQQAGGSGVA